MTISRRPTTDEDNALAEVRVAIGELFGAERRLRGREQGSQELTHSQIRALVALEKTDAVTAGRLAKSADLNPASVTAMLDTLEQNGIVKRERGSDDRRVCIVTLTEVGRKILAERRSTWQRLWEDYLGLFPDDELRRAVLVIRAITRLLDNT